MKTKDELNSDIIKISTNIFEKYPELSNYLAEMTDTIPNIKKPEMNIKNLTEYYNSLKSLLDNYIQSHNPQ